MTIAELLLPEFDQEMASTRRVLERVPEDKFAWQPHAKSFSMGNLASHVVNMLQWTVDTMDKAQFDLDGVTPEEMNQAAKTRAELLAWFDANARKARAALQKERRRLSGAVDVAKGRARDFHDAALYLRPQFLPEPHHPSPRAAHGLPARERRAGARPLRSVRGRD